MGRESGCGSEGRGGRITLERIDCWTDRATSGIAAVTTQCWRSWAQGIRLDRSRHDCALAALATFDCTFDEPNDEAQFGSAEKLEVKWILNAQLVTGTCCMMLQFITAHNFRSVDCCISPGNVETIIYPNSTTYTICYNFLSFWTIWQGQNEWSLKRVKD